MCAKSTEAGDDLDVDWLMIFPVQYGYAEISAGDLLTTPATFTARDEFDQAGGNLAGKTLPVGGTWSGAGDATDFTVDTGTKRATRTSSNVTDRYQRAGAGTLAGVIVRADLTLPLGRQGGLFARYTDTSNHLLAYIAGAASPVTLTLHKRVAGIVTILDTITIAYSDSYRVELVALATGDAAVFVNRRLVCRAFHADLATGGTLATGGYGMFDSNSPFPVAAGFYDDFQVFAAGPGRGRVRRPEHAVPVERGHPRGLRRATFWQPVSRHRGSYLRVPVARAEGRDRPLHRQAGLSPRSDDRLWRAWRLPR